MTILRQLIIVALGISLCLNLSSRGLAEEFPKPLAGTGPGAEGGQRRFITIDFDDVDIHLFIKYISELTGKNFVVDKTVQDQAQLAVGLAYQGGEVGIKFVGLGRAQTLRRCPNTIGRALGVEHFFSRG